MSTAYDFSFARPDPASLGDGALRYLAPVGWFSWPEHSAGKVVGLDELAALWAAGIPVGLVWEIDTNDYLGGYDQGVAYGQLARAMATQLSYPADWPIYCAVDCRLTAAQRALALEYQRGFHVGAANGRPYGEGALIEDCVGTYQSGKGWMPETWGGSVDHVALVQLVNPRPGVVFVDGTDANVIVDPDWGGYLPGVAPPIPTPTTMEDLTWLYPML